MNQIFVRLIAMKKICGPILLAKSLLSDKDNNKMLMAKGIYLNNFFFFGYCYKIFFFN